MCLISGDIIKTSYKGKKVEILVLENRKLLVLRTSEIISQEAIKRNRKIDLVAHQVSLLEGSIC